jgi:hypothetical protein
VLQVQLAQQDLLVFKVTLATLEQLVLLVPLVRLVLQALDILVLLLLHQTLLELAQKLLPFHLHLQTHTSLVNEHEQ